MLAEVPLAFARCWGGWNLQPRETSQLTTSTLAGSQAIWPWSHSPSRHCQQYILYPKVYFDAETKFP